MSRRPGNENKADRVPVAGRAVLALLNSRPHSIQGDRLDEPEHAAAIVAQFGATGEELSVEVLETIRAIRADLVAAITAETREDAESAWREFTSHTSGVVLQQDFSVPGEVRLCQVAGEPAIGRIALIVAELVSAGEWSRVRICGNDVCAGVFYDTTRSRTQRWDSYETCGNRLNVAAHRARSRKSSGGTPSDH